MKLMIAFANLFLILLSLAEAADAQTPIVTFRLAKDQIATVKTAPGITTRLVFPDQVTEIICGDLYDPTSGRGTFVIQRGANDVFLKPVATRGLSNMFVKTGQSDENVYSFDLLIVTVEQAHRVVNVLDTQSVPVARSKAQFPATRISLTGMPGIVAIDWNTANSLTGFGLGAYSVQGSGDVPPEPLPQKLAVPSSKQPAARVPILGDPTKRVKAIYPEFAKAAGMNGEVAVEIIVDESGKVISAKALSGPAVLRQAAISAALGWKFTPTRVDGSPTQAVGTIRFRFEPLADNRNARARTNGRVSDVSSGTANGRRP